MNLTPAHTTSPCLPHFPHTLPRYITSMYWAYTTMTTVGYGDICGTIIAEKVW